jgi:hypothetical protein
VAGDDQLIRCVEVCEHDDGTGRLTGLTAELVERGRLAPKYGRHGPVDLLAGLRHQLGATRNQPQRRIDGTGARRGQRRKLADAVSRAEGRRAHPDLI